MEIKIKYTEKGKPKIKANFSSEERKYAEDIRDAAKILYRNVKGVLKDLKEGKLEIKITREE